MYKITIDGVLSLFDMAFIPNDSKNKDWRKYQKWLESGNLALPIEKEVLFEDPISKLEKRIYSLEKIIKEKNG